jgi:hypothetical protein
MGGNASTCVGAKLTSLFDIDLVMGSYNEWHNQLSSSLSGKSSLA